MAVIKRKFKNILVFVLLALALGILSLVAKSTKSANLTKIHQAEACWDVTGGVASDCGEGTEGSCVGDCSASCESSGTGSMG